MFPGEIGAGGLVAGGHFELGPAEFLHLEGVAELRRGQVIQAARGIQVQLRISKVERLGQGESEVKAAQRVWLHLAIAQLVALRHR